MQVHEPRFYARLLAQGSFGLGESYMDGWWDAQDLDGLLYRLLNARLEQRRPGFAALCSWLRALLVNEQSRRRSFAVGQRHYDIGNELYRAMLGQRMVYSCGYWAVADTLDKAQEAKLDLVCRKLMLQPGQRLLDGANC